MRPRLRRGSLLLLPGVAAAAIATAVPARASAPPVGPIPKGPVTTVSTSRGQLVAVALPRKPNGVVWRLARPIDPRVVRQVSEATVDGTIVIVFRATGRGAARVVFALTRGETARAHASATYAVRVS